MSHRTVGEGWPTARLRGGSRDGELVPLHGYLPRLTTPSGETYKREALPPDIQPGDVVEYRRVEETPREETPWQEEAVAALLNISCHGALTDNEAHMIEQARGGLRNVPREVTEPLVERMREEAAAS